MESLKEQTKESKMIGSVLKAIDVLVLLPKSEEGYTVTEISTLLNQGISATYHILNTLRSRDFVEQDKRTKRYKLGPGLLTLCSTNSRQDMIRDLAYEYLNCLTDEFDETSNLMMLVGHDVEYIAQVESKQLLKMFTKRGARVPFYCTGGGKAIFAFKSPQAQASMLNGLTFKPYTKKTITSAEQLYKEAALIRKQGYAMDMEEREVGVSCIAAPIFDNKSSPVAAISISCPIYRLNTDKQERMISSIILASRNFSAALGYSDNMVSSQ